MLEPSLRSFYYDRLLNKTGGYLSKVRPQEVWTILEAELRRVSRASPMQLNRSAIEDTDQDFLEHPGDHLIVAARNALIDLADFDTEHTTTILPLLLADEVSVLRRLALHLLIERPQYIPTSSPDLILPESVYDQEAFHEQLRLIQSRFNVLPGTVQDRIHRVVSKAFSSPSLSAPDGDADREVRVAWRLLNVLPGDALNPDEVRLRDTLLVRFGGYLEHPLFLAWFSHMQDARSPADWRSLRQIWMNRGLDALLEVLRNPGIDFQVDWFHDAELVWSEVAAWVKEHPDETAIICDYIQPSDFSGAWRYFDAYEGIARDGKPINTLGLLTNVKRLLESENAAQTHWSLGRFLNGMASTLPSPVPAEEGSLVVECAATILEREFVPLGEIATPQPASPDHQLNTAAGSAADALLSIQYRRATENPPEGATEGASVARPVMTGQLKETLQRSVGQAWGGLELRHAIGQWIHHLVYLDSTWLDSNLDGLLPLPKEAEVTDLTTIGAWRSFWHGYFVSGRIMKSVAESLRSRYAVLVENAVALELLLPPEVAFRDGVDLLGQSLRIGWLRGFDGFGLDGLFGQYYGIVSDDRRSEIVTALGHDLAESTDIDDEEFRRQVRAKLQGLWEARFVNVEPSNTDSRTLELSAFASWLANLDYRLKDIEYHVSLIAENVQIGFEVEQIVEYLLTTAEHEPRETTTILRVLVDRVISAPDIIWLFAKLPELVKKLANATAGTEYRPLLNSIVGDLLMQRQIDLREQLV